MSGTGENDQKQMLGGGGELRRKIVNYADNSSQQMLTGISDVNNVS